MIAAKVFVAVAMYSIFMGVIWVVEDDLPNAAMCVSIGSVFLNIGAMMRMAELQDRLSKMESQNKEDED